MNTREWKEVNRERVQEYQRRWRRENKVKVAEYDRTYRKKHKATVAARKRAAYLANHANELIKRRQWRKANPDKNAAGVSRYRVRKRGNGIVDKIDRQVVLAQTNGLCGICGLPVDPTDFHVDHIIPVSKGGEESYANTQPAHPSCNIRKGATLGRNEIPSDRLELVQ